jgi:peptidase E
MHVSIRVTSTLKGRIALAGSGEFTSALEPLDRRLLPSGSHVLVLPPASVRDGEDAQGGWSEAAHRYFGQFPVTIEAPLSTCAICLESKLRRADVLWLSGDDPRWLAGVLRPLRDQIYARLHDGMVLAGSSAGAMVLGTFTLPKLAQPPRWTTGLDIVPNIGVIPHFDEQTPRRIKEMVMAAPPGLPLVGIDAETWILLSSEQLEVGGKGGATLYRDGRNVFRQEGASASFSLAAL